MRQFFSNYRHLLAVLSAGSFYVYSQRREESKIDQGLRNHFLPQTDQIEDCLFQQKFHSLNRKTFYAFDLRRVNWNGADALSKAQSDVLAVWHSIDRDYSNLLVDKPRVTLLSNKLSIKFSISGSVDYIKFIMDIAELRKSKILIKDPEITLKIDQSGLSSLLQFDCIQPESTVAIKVIIPKTSQENPEIEILKEGPLIEKDIHLIEFVLRSIQKAGLHFRAKSKFLDSWTQSIPEDDPFAEFEDQMREIMQSLPFGDFHREGFIHPGSNQQLQFKKHYDEDERIVDGNAEELIRKLEGMGALVYRPNPTQSLKWGSLSGYDLQKKRIEDGLLLPLLYPDVVDSIARKTRRDFSSNRPRGVLFEGPPGTGKTTSARIIASQAAVHLVYLPLESILSKWYGESEKLLSEAFKFAEQLGGAIIFFDEIETLGANRNSEMHEASRRLLSVLLREMDGFDVTKKIIVVGATNRKGDIDRALLSRFDSSIRFDLPNEECRRKIFKQYARQLNDKQIDSLAKEAVEMSGRDIRDVCEATERILASKIIRGESEKDTLPGFSDYLAALEDRRTSLGTE